MDPARQPPKLVVGQRDAAVGPVDASLHGRGIAAQPVDPDVAAERRVLRGQAPALESPHDGAKARAADQAFAPGAQRRPRGRIVEPEEFAEAAVAVDPRDAEIPARGDVVARQVQPGGAAAADGDVVESFQDMIMPRQYRQRQPVRIDDQEGRAVSRCHAAAERPQHDGRAPRQAAARTGGLARLRACLLGAGVALALGGALAPAARAASFALPAGGDNMVGHMRVITLENPGNTLLDIARHYDLGYNEITAANPGVSVWLPGVGTRIVVPTEFILPPKPWVGIVVDIPQRRLYYFPTPRAGRAARVITFPIGIARRGWPTPLGRTRIIAKYRDPSWIVPKDIQQEHRSEGDPQFPSYFPPGPGNPMGMLAMQTGFPEIFIHGTDRPWGIGMRVSHGCMHLYPEDAAYLFPRVPVGTPVRIIDRPVLAGIRGHQLYVSAAPAVSDYPSAQSYGTRAVAALSRLRAHHPGQLPEPLPWQQLLAAAQARRIVPVPIGSGASRVERELAALRPAAYKLAPYGVDANNAATPPLAAAQR